MNARIARRRRKEEGRALNTAHALSVWFTRGDRAPSERAACPGSAEGDDHPDP